jgi:hypothetical protein
MNSGEAYYNNLVIYNGNGALKNEAKEYTAQNNTDLSMEEVCGNSI